MTLAGMAFTQQDIDQLKAAMASGELMIRSGDRSTQFRSIDEMERLLRRMEAEVGNRSSYTRLGRIKAIFRRD